MKNLKACFVVAALSCLAFAGSMAAANSGHVQAPAFRSEPVVLAEQMIVGSVSADETIPMTIVVSAHKATHKPAGHKIAQVRVTDLEQGGSPTSGSVIRYN